MTDKKNKHNKQQHNSGNDESIDSRLKECIYEECISTHKWALRIIIALVIVLVGYGVYRNDKEYRQVLSDAKEARNKAEESCENAREYERQAHEKLTSINQLVAGKLEEIEKTGNEKIQTLLKEAERQRKISKLFSKSSTAFDVKDYETAADCYRQIVEQQKEENDLDVYYDWGVALSYLAESKKGPEAEELLNQAMAKYKKVIDIEPNYYHAYNNWGYALLNLVERKKGKDAEDLLRQAEEKFLKAESIRTGEGAYSLARIYARRGNKDKCKEWLKVGEKAGTLIIREHAMADDDLKSVRDKDWFKKLRWMGE